MFSNSISSSVKFDDPMGQQVNRAHALETDYLILGGFEHGVFYTIVTLLQ